MAIAVINDFSNKLFELNGIKYVRNFMAVKYGNNVSIKNAYDTRFAVVSGHFSDYIVNGNTFSSAETLINSLSAFLFVKDELLMTGPGEAENKAADAVFHNVYGTWVESPSAPASGTINLDLTDAVNGGLCVVYYKGGLIDKTIFTNGTIVILSGQNIINELCAVWIVYDKGSNGFSVNIQTGDTGDLPVGGDAPAKMSITSVVAGGAAPAQMAILTVTGDPNGPAKMQITSVT